MLGAAEDTEEGAGSRERTRDLVPKLSGHFMPQARSPTLKLWTPGLRHHFLSSSPLPAWLPAEKTQGRERQWAQGLRISGTNPVLLLEGGSGPISASPPTKVMSPLNITK